MTREDKAILDMLAYAEGTLGVSNNGYDVVVGSKRVIAGWTKDTNIVHGGKDWFSISSNSTAAGRYQFLYNTWTNDGKSGNKPMTAANQDARALELINSKTSGINKSILGTNVNEFNKLLQSLCTIWASLPATKTVTDKQGKVHNAGSSYYSSDGINKSRSAEKLYEIFKLALSYY
jgi:muramidase (phage lysozyme)